MVFSGNTEALIAPQSAYTDKQLLTLIEYLNARIAAWQRNLQVKNEVLWLPNIFTKQAGWEPLPSPQDHPWFCLGAQFIYQPFRWISRCMECGRQARYGAMRLGPSLPCKPGSCEWPNDIAATLRTSVGDKICRPLWRPHDGRIIDHNVHVPIGKLAPAVGNYL